MRTFLAIPVGPSLQRPLYELTQHLQQQWRRQAVDAALRWIPAQNYHLTLAFLGELPVQKTASLNALLAATVQGFCEEQSAGRKGISWASQPWYVPGESLQWFPSALKPRLLVLIMQPDEHLLRLQSLLSKALRREGFTLEKKPFVPHISLARVAVGTPVSQLLEQTAVLAITPALGQGLCVDKVVCYESRLGQHGPVYRPVFSEAL